MKISSEVKSYLQNIRYYSQEIEKLAKKQYNEDMETGTRLGVNTMPGSLRSDALACIASNCSWVEVYLDAIIKNLEVAEEQDKLLYSEDYVEQKELV